MTQNDTEADARAGHGRGRTKADALSTTPHPASRREREPESTSLAARSAPARHRSREEQDAETGPRSFIPMPVGIDALDRLVHANMGRLTGNLSPASVSNAFADWAFHLAISPGKQAELGVKALRKATRLAIYAV
ncbi:MAG: poly-beta-hydroxybutyrate polymerase N-terminal domain-containing protein, partial [Thiohalocapsa sp.]